MTILASKPNRKRIADIPQLDFGKDEFHVAGDVVYLHCPGGMAKTKLTNGFFESKLEVEATSRNWRTLNKLVEMSR